MLALKLLPDGDIHDKKAKETDTVRDSTPFTISY